MSRLSNVPTGSTERNHGVNTLNKCAGHGMNTMSRYVGGRHNFANKYAGKAREGTEMRLWAALLLGFIILLTGGCASPASPDRVVNVSTGDAKMNAGMATARATVAEFTAALASPKIGQTAFSVKMPVSDGSVTEHIWLSGVTYDGKAFHGTINNKPETVHTVKLDQAVTVPATEISDWMFVDNGVLAGGYTIRVLRDQMAPAERAEFDKSVPFTVK